MQLFVDRRERALSNALEDVAHILKDLPVGDVLCQYTDGRASWVAERKRATDLAASIASGRHHPITEKTLF